MEFLVHMEVVGLPEGERGQELLRHEAQRAKELATRGILRRLWRVPGRRANWGIWIANSAEELHEALATLPLFPYLQISVHLLSKHPNDPGLPLTSG